MALAPLPSNTFPDVPVANGVPTVFRPNAFILGVEKTVLLAADVLTVIGLFQGPQWGIFNQDGQLVANPDTFISMDFRQEYRISDYPRESGSFETYDKVQMPYDVRCTLGCHGKNMSKTAFLSAIDAATRSLDRFHILTPDAGVPSVSLVHYDYRRERARGNGILIVDIWMQQLITDASASYTNTQQPEGAPNQAGGTVQPQAAPPGLSADDFDRTGP